VTVFAATSGRRLGSHGQRAPFPMSALSRKPGPLPAPARRTGLTSRWPC